MDITPAGLLKHARSEEGRKQLRYAGVAILFVPLGQLIVQILVWVFEIDESLSVLFTAVMLTPFNYLANKQYVWKDKRKDRVGTEITVFWLAAILGTGFAMAFVWGAGEMFPKSSGELSHGIAIFCAQLLGYGIVWVGRYLFLDKLIFKATHQGDDPPDEVLDDLHREFPI